MRQARLDVSTGKPATANACVVAHRKLCDPAQCHTGVREMAVAGPSFASFPLPLPCYCPVKLHPRQPVCKPSDAGQACHCMACFQPVSPSVGGGYTPSYTCKRPDGTTKPGGFEHQAPARARLGFKCSSRCSRSTPDELLVNPLCNVHVRLHIVLKLAARAAERQVLKQTPQQLRLLLVARNSGTFDVPASTSTVRAAWQATLVQRKSCVMCETIKPGAEGGPAAACLFLWKIHTGMHART
eukprot:353449-Chlamydomonas_euryale.AAC.9